MTKHKFKFTKKRRRFRFNGYAQEGKQAKRKSLELEQQKQITDYVRTQKHNN